MSWNHRAGAAGGLQLFALGASQPFARQVAAVLGLELAAHEEREFEDGEHKARPLACVRGRDAYVVHTLHGEAGHSANDKLCRLLFFIGALKDAGAARVTAVVPYLAYSRKDRRTKPYDPVTTRYVARLFEAAGADSVLTMDAHNIAAYENAFRIPAIHLEAATLLAAYIAPLAGGAAAVVSPDAGGAKRAERFRQALARVGAVEATSALAEKYRSAGVLSGSLLAGDVEGRTAIIVDDLVSTGATLARTARTCRDQGATRVFALATHALFAAGAADALADAAIERVVVTDTVAPGRLAGSAAAAKLTVLSCAQRFAAAIRALHEGRELEDEPA